MINTTDFLNITAGIFFLVLTALLGSLIIQIIGTIKLLKAILIDVINTKKKLTTRFSAITGFLTGVLNTTRGGDIK